MNASYFGLANLVAGHEARYPMIVRALQNVEPALNPRIEWAIEIAPDRDDTETDWNYCEIIQTPFDAGSSWDSAIQEHLEAIERAFTDGERSAFSHPGEYNARKCAGALTLLGRMPEATDEVKYRPLRDTQLCLNVQKPGDPGRNAWVTEASVQVVARRRQRVTV